ncbi:hypothetical protein LX36DRAFT_390534 [Colletotrichum falcatum]|nr:hypothetical protein LX36DRAFT_390534 [Colletotrichum falcatum]
MPLHFLCRTFSTAFALLWQFTAKKLGSRWYSSTPDVFPPSVHFDPPLGNSPTASSRRLQPTITPSLLNLESQILNSLSSLCSNFDAAWLHQLDWRMAITRAVCQDQCPVPIRSKGAPNIAPTTGRRGSQTAHTRPAGRDQ